MWHVIMDRKKCADVYRNKYIINNSDGGGVIAAAA
jgi:hypothetical protein